MSGTVPDWDDFVSMEDGGDTCRVYVWMKDGTSRRVGGDLTQAQANDMVSAIGEAINSYRGR